MQSRELPRVITVEAQAREALLDEESPPRSRFARLDFVRAPRRLDWFRLALACVVGAAIVSGVGYFGLWVIRSAVAWLHAQPKYQLAFDKIELDPPAPEWILRGNRTVLQSVLKNSREDENLAVPTLESGRLTKSFKKSPWVRDVRSIQFTYPNQVVVELSYRKPVAAIRPNKQTWIVLDEEAVILPDAEIDNDKVGLSVPSQTEEVPLITLQGQSKELPRDRSPGTMWKTTPIDSEPSASDGYVYLASKLAGFFNRKLSASPSEPKSSRIYTIHIRVNERDRCELWICNFEMAWFLWGGAPGEETPGDLSAEEKWAIFSEWARIQPRPVISKDSYGIFQKGGIEIVTRQNR